LSVVPAARYSSTPALELEESEGFVAVAVQAPAALSNSGTDESLGQSYRRVSYLTKPTL
jgi:hypothetical protein